MWRCQWSLCSLSVVALIAYNIIVNIWLLRPSSCPTQVRQLEELMPSQSSSPIASVLRLVTQECTPCTTFPPSPVQDDPISEMDIRLGQWDARHVYRLFDFVIVDDEYADLSEVRKVCLATQSLIEKLYSLIELADHWSGPISVSVYAAGDELRLVRAFMLYVGECYPRAYNRLAVHMVITSERTPVMDPLPTELTRIIMKCLSPKLFVSKLLTFRHRDTTKWRVKSVYPQNHLRNLARRNCQTSHVFLVDVDIVPSRGMAETLDKFIRGASKCNLCAFVIPTYELDEHVQFPVNKSDLVRLSKKGLAIPFHQKVFIYNQFASNFTREMIENAIAPKPQKMSATEHAQLTDLLLSKDAELKKTLDLAGEQAKIQQKINQLKMEVDNQMTWRSSDVDMSEQEIFSYKDDSSSEVKDMINVSVGGK